MIPSDASSVGAIDFDTIDFEAIDFDAVDFSDVDPSLRRMEKEMLAKCDDCTSLQAWMDAADAHLPPASVGDFDFYTEMWFMNRGTLLALIDDVVPPDDLMPDNYFAALVRRLLMRYLAACHHARSQDGAWFHVVIRPDRIDIRGMSHLTPSAQ